MNEANIAGTILKWAAVALAGLFLSTAGCVANKDYQTRKALEAGVDPLLVGCSMGRDGGYNSCQIAAARDRK